MKNLRWVIIFGGLLVIGFTLLPSQSKGQRITYKTRQVVDQLNCPWEIRWGKDNWIWFTERAGRFNRVNPETGELHRLLAESEVYSLGERGMLGFDFHPDFPDSPFIYICYTYADSTSQPDTTLYFEKVVRYTFSHDSGVVIQGKEPDTLTAPVVIIDHIRAYTAHNGSRVLVGPDQKLYVSTGETYFDPRLAQEDSSINGKILRVNLDGSIPADNPWPGSAVWSKGHRNPEGLWFGPDSTLYSSEHGPENDDELNIILRGRNYGWPNVEGFCDKPEEMQFCNDSNVVEPIAAWTPTLAVCGIEYYNSDRIPEWKNSILMCTLKDESLWHLKLDASRHIVTQQNRYDILLRTDETDSGDFAHRLRDVCFSPDGRVFVSTSNVWSVEWTPDRIFEIIRTGVDDVRAESAESNPLTLYPNPVFDIAHIDGLGAGISHVSLVDPIGRRLSEQDMKSAGGTLNLSGIRPGFYYVVVSHEATVQALPLVVR